MRVKDQSSFFLGFVQSHENFFKPVKLPSNNLRNVANQTELAKKNNKEEFKENGYDNLKGHCSNCRDGTSP